jgi:hypothetical protein
MKKEGIRGQLSIEYMLLIGGAVLAAIIIIAFLLSGSEALQGGVGGNVGGIFDLTNRCGLLKNCGFELPLNEGWVIDAGNPQKDNTIVRHGSSLKFSSSENSKISQVAVEKLAGEMKTIECTGFCNTNQTTICLIKISGWDSSASSFSKGRGIDNSKWVQLKTGAELDSGADDITLTITHSGPDDVYWDDFYCEEVDTLLVPECGNKIMEGLPGNIEECEFDEQCEAGEECAAPGTANECTCVPETASDCGNGTCESPAENQSNCCVDCGCPAGEICQAGSCIATEPIFNGDFSSGLDNWTLSPTETTGVEVTAGELLISTAVTGQSYSGVIQEINTASSGIITCKGLCKGSAQNYDFGCQLGFTGCTSQDFVTEIPAPSDWKTIQISKSNVSDCKLFAGKIGGVSGNIYWDNIVCYEGSCGDGTAQTGEECGEPGLSCSAGESCENCTCITAPVMGLQNGNFETTEFTNWIKGSWDGTEEEKISFSTEQKRSPAHSLKLKEVTTSSNAIGVYQTMYSAGSIPSTNIVCTGYCKGSGNCIISTVNCNSLDNEYLINPGSSWTQLTLNTSISTENSNDCVVWVGNINNPSGTNGDIYWDDVECHEVS